MCLCVLLQSSVVTAKIEWKNVPGKLRTVSARDATTGWVVGSDAADHVPYHRNTENTGWISYGGLLKQISNGASGVWGVSASNDAWVW